MIGKIILFTIVMMTATSSYAAFADLDPIRLSRYHEGGDPILCDNYLQMAKHELLAAQGKAIHHNLFIDWSKANEALAAALDAQRFRDYHRCVTQAEQTIDYTQRADNYMNWQGGLFHFN